MPANPLLPALTSFDPAYPWPTELDAAGVEMLYVATRHLVDRARELAASIQDEDTPPPDLLLMVWSSQAGQDATKVLHAARVSPVDQVGGALWLSVSAALMVEEARFRAHGPARGTCHGKIALNRALGIAEWIGAYRAGTPVTAEHAARVFGDHMPPNWRWERRPIEQHGTGGEAPLIEFTLTRSAQDNHSYERIAITGRGAGPVEIIRSHIGRTPSGMRPTWPQLCTYLAETYGRLYEPQAHHDATSPA